ncbi:MFS transporter [Patescibacteria group bacterium]|nr:MFS transporter [Patescibacteria group bacterium]
MYFYRRPEPNSVPKHKIKFWFVYLLAVVFNFHTLLVSYTSPTYLGNFIDLKHIGLLYSIGSIGSLLLFILLPSVLQRFGNVLVTLGLMVISIGTLAMMGVALSSPSVVIGLILFLIINPLMYLSMDIFSETLIGKNEGATGHVRGMTLSLMSLAALCAPLTISYLVGDGDNLAQLYFIAIGVGVVFSLIVILAFRGFVDPLYHRVQFRPLLKQCWESKALKLVLSAHFLVQVFFTWTVVYIPLYLASVLNLPWSSIGAIIASGLLAYVLFEYPIGILADDYFGEKEMMAIGFLILALTVSSISFMTATSILPWMILAFISRIGASLTEVTTESYFFKKVDGQDANLMSVFRLTRPLAVLAGSLLGSICLAIMPFHLAFIVLGFVMVIGIFLALGIEDTR